MLLMLIPYKDTLNLYSIYISTVANVIVILLMLVTIVITENSTRKQIESWDKWNKLQRKQLLGSLIKEFQLNMGVYKALEERLENEKFEAILNNFILTSLEKSLYNSPIDDEILNYNLLSIYYEIRGHEDSIEITRVPSLTKKSQESILKSIVNTHQKNRDNLRNTIKTLEEYYKQL